MKPHLASGFAASDEMSETHGLIALGTVCPSYGRNQCWLSGWSLSDCCWFAVGRSEAIRQAYIKRIRHLLQKGASGLHREESTTCHKILKFILGALPFAIRFHCTQVRLSPLMRILKECLLSVGTNRAEKANSSAQRVGRDAHYPLGNRQGKPLLQCLRAEHGQ